jgi:ubiquinone biosynthesis protein COQ9
MNENSSHRLDALSARIAQKDAVLEAAFTNAAFDGWSSKTLQRSALDAGFDKAAAIRLFPRGIDDLLAWIDDWADRRMLAAVSVADLARWPVHRRIATLIEARLGALAPHREGLRRAFLIRGLPHNAVSAMRGLWHTVNRIWEAVGFVPQDGRDFSYYSRRATLAAVLASTMLYWLEDNSDNFADTRAFIGRRLADVMRFGKTAGSARGLLHRLPRFRPPLSTMAERAGYSPRVARPAGPTHVVRDPIPPPGPRS